MIKAASDGEIPVGAVIVKDGQIIYCYSLNVGAVTITDKCGQDFEKAFERGIDKYF